MPGTSNSVVLLSGDSGHGFKMFPIFGKLVKALIENTAGKQSTARWKWKSAQSTKGEDWVVDVSWRLGKSEEFEEIRANPQSKL